MARFSMNSRDEGEDSDSDFDSDYDSDDSPIRLPNPKRRRTSETSSSSNSKSDHQQSSKDESISDSAVAPTKPPASTSVFLSDPDVLDCPICFNPLTVPVFQCYSGHIACSSCCVSLDKKCPSCRGIIGNIRCRAIEKVIESVQVSCCYLGYGCKKSISYCIKHEHEDKCIYAPCICPFPDCLFRGSPMRLSSHMSKEHVNFVTRFRYNSVFTVSLGADKKFLVLQEEKDGFLFILNQGNSVAVRCIHPSPSNGRFAYELVSRGGATSLKFQSFTRCTTRHFNDPLSVDYFPIPDYFYHSGGSDSSLKLEICIRSKDALVQSS
ncbi:E3 ubiquitin-protein ligase SINA-like 10 [Chenopodium quinoa]|uniref:E3 ubiquitin-protein ligase SINA-like 10 n=1 Tax=Chenopodium quinoa TaxID=63459 RepID=UPI000B78325C|nr:E3 ubiquitin-protein ligase SINA-like 10 [Chenopodium quinoa]